MAPLTGCAGRVSTATRALQLCLARLNTDDGGSVRPIRLHVSAAPRGPAGNGIVLARLVGPLLVYWSQLGGGAALVVGHKGADLRGDWWDRRRSHQPRLPCHAKLRLPCHPP